MNDLTSWFSGGGILIAVIWFVFNSYMSKRKEDSDKLLQLERDNAVQDAVQDEKIGQIERRLNKLEEK